MPNLHTRENHYTTSLNCALSVFPGGLFKPDSDVERFPEYSNCRYRTSPLTEREKKGVEKDDGKRDGPRRSRFYPAET